MSFRGCGIALHLGAKATRVEEASSVVMLHFKGSDGAGSVEGHFVFVSTGRPANVHGLRLDEIGIDYDERRGICTGGKRRTGQSHVLAVRDVADHWQLAHSAFWEDEIAVDNIAGHHAEILGHVPLCRAIDPLNSGARGESSGGWREPASDPGN